MTNARAKEVLEGMESRTSRLDAEEVHYPIPNRTVSSLWGEGGKLYLEGRFSLDELEAIACWMRDPKGVVEA